MTMHAFLEFIPLIVFFFVAKSHGVVLAAGALMAAMILVSIIQFFSQGNMLKKQQWVVLAITIVFCSLTLLLRDDVYVKWKTPIINWVFASVLLVSLLLNKLWFKNLMGKFINLTDRGWKNLTWVFVGYFSVLGALHYLFAFHFPEAVWLDFKVIYASIISFVFMGGVMFALRKHIKFDEMQKMEQEKRNNTK